MNYVSPVPPNGGSTNSEWSVGSGWTLSSNTSTSFGFDGCVFHISPASDPVTYTPSVVADTYDVYYLSSANLGTLTIQATAGTPLAIDTGIGNGIYKVTIHAGSASSSNAVSVLHTAGGGVFLLGIVPRLNSTKQVIICNLGIGGATSSEWNQGPTVYGTSMIQAFAPDLTIIMLGINDAIANGSSSNLVVNETALIGAAQVSGDVVLCSIVPTSSTYNSGTTYTNEQSYFSTFAQTATNTSAGYVDVWTAFGGVLKPSWTSSDGVHPNDVGYQQIGQLIYAVLPVPSNIALVEPSPNDRLLKRIHDRISDAQRGAFTVSELVAEINSINVEIAFLQNIEHVSPTAFNTALGGLKTVLSTLVTSDTSLAGSV